MKCRQRTEAAPQLALAAQAYIELINRPGTNLGTLVDALTSEADTAGRLIELANSDLFTNQRHSANLRQALANLGAKDALTMGLVCELFTTLQTFPAGTIDHDAFIQRACIAATWGKTLADEFGRSDGVELLLAAMIQDAGLLSIAHDAPDTYNGIDPLSIKRETRVQLESAALTTDHRQISASLAATWQLPDNVVRMLRLGYDLAADDIANRDRGFYRAMIFSADLTAAWCSPLTAGIVRKITADAQRYLGIDPVRLARLFDKVAVHAPQLASILGLESCTRTDCEAAALQFHDLLPPTNVRVLPANELPTHDLHDSDIPQTPLSTRAPAANLLHPMSYDDLLDEEFTLAVGNDWPLSLILVEIDDFEGMKACCGCKRSARVHNEIAALLSHNIRSSDTIAPQGEGRFMIVLPGGDADTATVVAQRVVAGAHRSVAHDDDTGSFSVTVSLGIVSLDQNSSFSKAADLNTAVRVALEHSTRSGRDRHTSYTSIRVA